MTRHSNTSTSFRMGAVLALLLMAACSVVETPLESRGHRVEEDLLKELVPGTSTRADVTALFGSPTARATFDDDSWIYVSTKNRLRIARYPRVEDQQVVLVKFDQNGTLREIKRLDKEDSVPVEMASGITPTPGGDMNFVQEFFANITRLRPGAPGGLGK